MQFEILRNYIKTYDNDKLSVYLDTHTLSSYEITMCYGCALAINNHIAIAIINNYVRENKIIIDRMYVLRFTRAVLDETFDNLRFRLLWGEVHYNTESILQKLICQIWQDFDV
jgi:hypothetical protein